MGYIKTRKWYEHFQKQLIIFFTFLIETGKIFLVCRLKHVFVKHIVHTCTQRRFPCPAAISPAGAVFRSSSQVESRLTGVDERITQRWQLYGTYIRLSGELRLITVMS